MSAAAEWRSCPDVAVSQGHQSFSSARPRRSRCSCALIAGLGLGLGLRQATSGLSDISSSGRPSLNGCFAAMSLPRLLAPALVSSVSPSGQAAAGFGSAGTDRRQPARQKCQRRMKTFDATDNIGISGDVYGVMFGLAFVMFVGLFALGWINLSKPTSTLEEDEDANAAILYEDDDEEVADDEPVEDLKESVTAGGSSKRRSK
ncbi:unnamed protein product [Polarella glacialis]|uniref:Uncharacterized protein n=1 Tax=Polarella glacialis TaxID=89957 RepID=A0A813EJY1_POLGL|nr:unnamed protein product [Polarella glacialis]